MNSISTIHQSYKSSQRLACLSYHLERVILIKSYPSFHLNIIQTYQHDIYIYIYTCIYIYIYMYIYIYTCIYIYIILPPTFQIIAPFNWLKSPISHIVFLFFIIFDPRSTRSTLKSRLYQLHVANLKQKHWKPRVVVR